MEPDANSGHCGVKEPILASKILAEILDKSECGEPVKYDGVIIEGDLDLSGLNLPPKHVDITEHELQLGLSEKQKVINSEIKITNSEIRGKLNFGNAQFQKTISFTGTEFWVDANFSGSEFDGSADFSRAKFTCEFVNFGGSKFGSWFTFFCETEFSGFVNFREAEFKGSTYFLGAKFGGEISFDKAQFGGFTNFGRAEFTGGFANFLGANFNGEVVTFKNAKFNNPCEQEYACRKAKQLLEQNGNRDEASHNFYLEMDAKRRMKPKYKSYPEKLFIMWIFGYGVYPIRVISTWIITVSIFALIYWNWNMVAGAKSLIDYIWFSIATAATPGYALFKPIGAYQLVSGLEAILGTFLWAAFIATFARKWMR